MTKKRFERIYADVDVFCRDHNAKGLSQLIEKEDYDTIVDLLNELNDEMEQLKQQYHKLNNKLHSIETILEDLGSKKYIGCDERLQVLNEISKVMWND